MKQEKGECYQCEHVVPFKEMLSEDGHLFCHQSCINIYYAPKRKEQDDEV